MKTDGLGSIINELSYETRVCISAITEANSHLVSQWLWEAHPNVAEKLQWELEAYAILNEIDKEGGK